jgi:quercetin dioxygenase-like cupin family protein
MEVIEKEWGTVKRILTCSYITIDMIGINKGGSSSKHRHHFHTNQFHIQHGVLEITTWDNDGIDKTYYLHPGDTVLIEAETWHRFKAITLVIAVEVTSLSVDNLQLEDIERA